jgi:hypothetical protein
MNGDMLETSEASGLVKTGLRRLGFRKAGHTTPWGIDRFGDLRRVRGLGFELRSEHFMLRTRQNKLMRAARRCWIGAFALCLLALGSQAVVAPTPAPLPLAQAVPARQTSPAPAAAPTLDQKHLWALGMIETGNNDWEVGGAGEVSRYQIHPAVWKAYCASRDYENPVVSVRVAKAHWTYLAEYFKEHAGRTPTDFDMYVMWNTTYGYYAHKGFDPHRLAPVVQDRAQRFVNLVHRKA